MRLELEGVSGEILTVDKFTELCFTQSAGVACDSLWAYFYSDGDIFEISKVRAYENGRLVFNGFCDCQKRTEDSNGSKNYFYARSSACVLVDNEAQGVTYDKPSAKQLSLCNAEKYGFKTNLPDIYSNMKYEVSKGTSCFTAVNQFVLLLTGNCICVSPENEISLQLLSDDLKSLDKYNILSSVAIINRSEPYSQILFKKEYSSPQYSMHTESALAMEAGIERTAYINLSSLPQWQRERTVLQRLKDSFSDYKMLEIKVSGFADEVLLQRFNYKTYSDYVLSEKRYVCDKNGEYTRLILKKNLDIKEITYVD